MFDVKLLQGEGNLSKDSWARVPALQVVDKSLLIRHVGTIRSGALNEITAQILNYLGLIGEADELVPAAPPSEAEDEPYPDDDDNLF